MCPNPANSGLRSLSGLKKRFSIDDAWCLTCLRCQCPRLLELEEGNRNPDCLAFVKDDAVDACVECEFEDLCSITLLYATQ